MHLPREAFFDLSNFPLSVPNSVTLCHWPIPFLHDSFPSFALPFYFLLSACLLTYFVASVWHQTLSCRRPGTLSVSFARASSRLNTGPCPEQMNETGETSDLLLEDSNPGLISGSWVTLSYLMIFCEIRGMTYLEHLYRPSQLGKS